MTAFLIGYALGNLPYGPFSNRYGRKPAIYLGTLLAIIGSLLILMSGAMHSYGILIVGRFLQALGSSVGLKITFTIVGDVYSQTRATKKISFIMLSFAIAPGLAMWHAKNKLNASAVMNFINMGVCVVSLLIIEALPAHKTYVLPLFFLILSCLMLILRLTFLKRIQRNYT